MPMLEPSAWTACLPFVQKVGSCRRPSSPKRGRQGARVQVRALRNVRPALGRSSELHEAIVDPTRHFINATGVGQHLAGDLVERLHDCVIELADSYRSVLNEHPK